LKEEYGKSEVHKRIRTVKLYAPSNNIWGTDEEMGAHEAPAAPGFFKNKMKV
jgi:hypothetical protein